MGTAFSKTPEGPPPLTPVVDEDKGAEGDPRLVYTWQGRDRHSLTLVRSCTPSGGGAPRLVATSKEGEGRNSAFNVWDTGNGAFVGALEGSSRNEVLGSLLTYQRASDGRPRIAGGTYGGHLCIWDGDDLSMHHTVETHPMGYSVRFLAVYEEPEGKRTRLVTG
jgi:hypothetical protein